MSNKSKALSREERERLLASTHEAAVALVDDMEHLRSLMATPTISQGDVRGMSTILRRLVVDQDIPKVAYPRTARIYVPSPQNADYYDFSKGNWGLIYFASGGAEVFGLSIRATLLASGHKPPLGPPDPEDSVDLHFESFAKQKVLFFDGNWATRQQAIKFIANLCSGAHSDSSRKKEEELLLEKIRRVAFIRMQERVELIVNASAAMGGPPPPLNLSKHHLDPVLIELIAAAQLLVKAPDILTLETHIKREG